MGKIDRLEQVVQILVEDQIDVRKLIAELATETRRGFDQVAVQFAETDRLMRESARNLDERISNLVLAIGELIRNQNQPRS